MRLKQRDATRSRIAYLESYTSPDMDTLHRQGVEQATARLKADNTSKSACQLIDHYFAQSDDWVVIHDLRIGVGKQTMHINHLLISRALEFYIIDSRYIEKALTLNENGQCWVETNKRSAAIASPLNKLHRDVRLLQDIIKSAKKLPRLLGISPLHKVQGYVLTNPTLKSHKPASDKLDASAIIAADALFPLVWQKPQSWVRSKVGGYDTETFQAFAQVLLSLHVPIVSPAFLNSTQAHYNPPAIDSQDTSRCASCSTPVTAYARERCFRHMDTYDGKVLCLHCQVEAQNQPKHQASA